MPDHVYVHISYIYIYKKPAAYLEYSEFQPHGCEPNKNT